MTEYLAEDLKDIFENIGNNPKLSIYKYENTQYDGSENLNYGFTIINSGNLNGEYYMTKGHKHLIPSAEIYKILEGSGVLYEITEENKEIIHSIEEGDIIYINPTSAHRVINTGNSQLKFFTVVRADAGHDYNIKFPTRFFNR